MINYSAAYRCVFVFRLPTTRYALKLVLFPGNSVPDDCLRKTDTRGSFTWGPRGRKLADATFLGEVHLAEDALDLEVISHEAYHVSHRAWTSNRHSEEDCAELAGMIIAAICLEIHKLGKKVPIMLATNNVQRIDDRWPNVQLRNRLFQFSPEDPPVETGDALDDESRGDQDLGEAPEDEPDEDEGD
jgi:hypothetical protein